MWRFSFFSLYEAHTINFDWRREASLSYIFRHFEKMLEQLSFVPFLHANNYLPVSVLQVSLVFRTVEQFEEASKKKVSFIKFLHCMALKFLKEQVLVQNW